MRSLLLLGGQRKRTMSSVPAELWVQLKAGIASNSTKVPTKGCKDVDDLIVEIKKKLQIPNPPQEINLHLFGKEDALSRDRTLSEICVGNSLASPLVVSIQPPATVAAPVSVTHFQGADRFRSPAPAESKSTCKSISPANQSRCSRTASLKSQRLQQQ